MLNKKRTMNTLILASGIHMATNLGGSVIFMLSPVIHLQNLAKCRFSDSEDKTNERKKRLNNM